MNSTSHSIAKGILTKEINTAKDSVIREGNRVYLKSAITRQITNCIANENYRAGIFVSLRPKLDIVADILKDIVEEYHMISDSNDNRSIILSQNEVIMKFESGSTIKAVVASENSRGRRFNDIICDHQIDNELIDVVVKPTFINYDHFNPNSREYSLKFIECEF